VTVCSNLVNIDNETRLAGATIQPYATISYSDGERVGYAGTMPVNIDLLVFDTGTLVPLRSLNTTHCVF
jgi:hypothetical protein